MRVRGVSWFAEVLTAAMVMPLLGHPGKNFGSEAETKLIRGNERHSAAKRLAQEASRKVCSTQGRSRGKSIVGRG